MEEAERLCDRVAIVDHGKVIGRGTPSQLIASIGIGHLIEFSAGDDAASIDLRALERIEGVRSAALRNGGVTIEAGEPALLARLSDQGTAISGLRTHSASLEDVFVSLTGRHLRDE
jgi:ABC-2 type transport system ATP-binding protein